MKINNVNITSSAGSLSYEENSKLLAINNYYPFGMLQPGLSYNSSEYRFGFNGMEKDDEIQGVGNSLDFGARMYDSRLGRWFSRDPLFQKYPFVSPYASMGNNPNVFIDKDGRDIYFYDENDKCVSVIVTGNSKDIGYRINWLWQPKYIDPMIVNNDDESADFSGFYLAVYTGWIGGLHAELSAITFRNEVALEDRFNTVYFYASFGGDLGVGISADFGVLWGNWTKNYKKYAQPSDLEGKSWGYDLGIQYLGGGTSWGPGIDEKDDKAQFLAKDPLYYLNQKSILDKGLAGRWFFEKTIMLGSSNLFLDKIPQNELDQLFNRKTPEITIGQPTYEFVPNEPEGSEDGEK